MWSVAYVLERNDGGESDSGGTEDRVDEIKGGREVVVGVAEWQRMGEGWEEFAGLGGWWDLSKLPTSLDYTHGSPQPLFSSRA